MKLRPSFRPEDERGFTLVELLVVIVILGILAAIVVFAVGGITDKGGESAKAADLRALEIAEEAFYAKTKPEPVVYASETDLVDGGMLRAASEKHNICLSNAVAAVVGPPAVAAIPAGKTYKIVDQPVAPAATVCGAGFTHAP
jgi:general secretion pathway protein G